VLSGVQMPRMNAICERVIGTLRRGLLERTLILGGHHLALTLREYVIRYYRHRPPQSRQQRARTPKPSPSGTWPT
jgi:putative transposase